MKKTTFQKTAFIGAAAFVAFTFILYWLAHEVWQYSVVDVPHVGVPLYSGENLIDGHTMQSVVPAGLDRLDTITVWPHIQGSHEGTVTLRIFQNGAEAAQREMDVSEFSEYVPYTAEVYAPVNKGAPVELSFGIGQGSNMDFLSFYRSKVEGIEENSSPMTLDYYGVKDRNLTIYWIVMGCLLSLYIAVCLWIGDCLRKGKKNFFLHLIQELHQYSFLTSQLVSRDFNTKYRQSVLGVLWSVLNPLMTTLVMYIVFSTMFKSTQENFAVYLLSGIIMFNFFSESTSLGVESITGNASIISKVYVPRYIYPVSRTFSSFINLLFSLIPLFLFVVVSGIKITKAFLLIPIPLILIFQFCCGMSMLLATGNVFFRDTKFLWSVVVMMWMYMTPLFYSETIIPAQFIHIYHMNPMYQFIYFFRSIVLYGVSPQPIIYVYSILASIVPLVIGILVFRKHQNKFALYL